MKDDAGGGVPSTFRGWIYLWDQICSALWPPTPTPGYEYFKVCSVQFSLQQCGNLDDTKPDRLLKFLSSSFLPTVPQAGTNRVNCT